MSDRLLPAPNPLLLNRICPQLTSYQALPPLPDRRSLSSFAPENEEASPCRDVVSEGSLRGMSQVSLLSFDETLLLTLTESSRLKRKCSLNSPERDKECDACLSKGTECSGPLKRCPAKTLKRADKRIRWVVFRSEISAVQATFSLIPIGVLVSLT